jgi:acetyl esterase/lipase
MTTIQEYRYGSHPSQFVRMHLPVGDHLPVVVVVHGGFWRSKFGIELAEPLAADLAKFGVAAAAVEYRRVGGGGGWPTTMADVARAVDHLATAGQYVAQGRLRLDRVAAVGHSAGGQLATWLTHRESLRSGTAGSITAASEFVPIIGAVSQAGVLDLIGGSDEHIGNGAVDDLMQGASRSVPQRYHHSSPLEHVGDGARVVCVHGDADESVPLSQSQRYVDAALAAGDPARLVVLPGVGHMELVDPAHEAWAICRDSLLQMV